MDDLLREFLSETGERLDQIDVELVRFEREPNDQALLRNIFRLVHTVKGTCGFLGLPRLEALAHAAETLMERFRDGGTVTSDTVGIILATIDRLKEILAALDRAGAEPDGSDAELIAALQRAAGGEPAAPSSVKEEPPAGAGAAAEPLPAEAGRPAGERNAPGPARVQTIRVGLDTLEHLMTMVSELVLTRNQLLDIARRQEGSAYQVPLQRLSHVTAELQEGVMKTRMQPIGAAWQKLPRMVRDLAAELGKSIDLVLEGAETELDRQVLEVVKDPLVHLVRNCADHGLESPAERRAAGKPERGLIRVAAAHEGGTITIEVADDGRGLDHGRIRRKALEHGLASAAELERMSDAQVAGFVFQPGFSTAAQVTALSGRGIGLDVVKANLDLVGGSVEVRSDPGRGTTVTVKIPLTLAIVPALLVGVGRQRFAIPQLAILEVVRVGPGTEHGVERLNGAAVLNLRDRLLPVLSLGELLGAGAALAGAAPGFVVAGQAGRRRFGLFVETICHTEEIVVKPMGARLRGIPYFSGHTILGDGTVVLILDPGGLARALGSVAGEESPDPRLVEGSTEAPETPTAMLVFRAGGPGPKAVPLALVSRLEEVDSASIEWAAGRALLQYRGRLMPIVAGGPGVEIGRSGTQSLIVFSDGARSVGVAVDDIVDIVEDVLAIELVADRPDLVGSAILREHATEIVDATHYLPAAFGTARPTVGRGRRTVLLIDGSPFFRDMLAAVVRGAGYRVLAIGAPEDASAFAEGGAPVDLVVADADGAGRDGLGLIERLRRSDRLGRVPVVAIASTVSREGLDRARALGVADFVQKFDRSGLLAALAEASEGELEAAA